MKGIRRLICLLLVMVLLTGCDLFQFLEAFSSIENIQTNPTLSYTRPDIDEHDRVLQRVCQSVREETDFDALLDSIYEYYDVYDLFQGNAHLAYIYYCSDTTDTYWSQENDYCTKHATTVDAGLESLNYALAASPLRQQLESEDYFGAGFFDAYEGENQWEDPQLLALMEKESQLINRFYSLSDCYYDDDYATDSWFAEYEPQMGEVLVELVQVRQQQAEYFGYDSYPQFAYDYYHYRDYTPQQATEYLQQVGQTLSDLYESSEHMAAWNLSYTPSTDSQNFRYVKTVAQAMGGDVEEAFTFMEENTYYDIAAGKNKYPISFEVFLPYYNVPFLFMAPEGSIYDRLTFAHEFGHYANDYLCGGSYAGTDVAEVHSQAMEYLSLLYGENTTTLTRLKMADSLSTQVEQSAFALFEHKLYDLQGEELTVENIHNLYDQICSEFGFDAWDWDSRDYITIPHFYDRPLYIISYVVSNDLAMQIYQLETNATGAGLEVYRECLYSCDSYIMSFAEEYGLESPFAPGRLEALRETFAEAFD